MQRIVQTTADSSPTIAIPGIGATCHSRRGAVQESRHVFIQAGLQPLQRQHNQLCIFEMGFGTGLNALLSLEQAIAREQAILYHAVEKYPLKMDEIHALDYTSVLPQQYFDAIHHCNWNEPAAIHPFFTLHKSSTALQEFKATKLFHLIYYDAFAPATQPELWMQQLFEQLHALLANGGVLVTYCSKGVVRRNMLAAGFSVEKLAGAPGKREMLRATKY